MQAVSGTQSCPATSPSGNLHYAKVSTGAPVGLQSSMSISKVDPTKHEAPLHLRGHHGAQASYIAPLLAMEKSGASRPSGEGIPCIYFHDLRITRFMQSPDNPALARHFYLVVRRVLVGTPDGPLT